MPSPGRLEHQHVVGAVADRHRLLEPHLVHLGHVLEHLSLSFAVHDRAREPSGDHAVLHFELVRERKVQAEALLELVDEEVEPAADEPDSESRDSSAFVRSVRLPA